MWQTKYALTVPKNLGVGVDFRLCSEDNFLTGCPCAEEFQPIVDALLYLPSCSKRKDHRVEIIHDPMGALNALGSQKKILIK